MTKQKRIRKHKVSYMEPVSYNNVKYNFIAVILDKIMLREWNDVDTIYVDYCYNWKGDSLTWKNIK